MFALMDSLRVPDANNPRGYCEWTPIRSLARTPEIIAAAEGKVVKVISSLLSALSARHSYRIIFMCRPLQEVVVSQNRMLERLGKQVPSNPTDSVIVAFQEHLEHIRIWLPQQRNMDVLFCDYSAVVEKPRDVANTISTFLRQDLNIEAMMQQVEASLYREKEGLTV